MNFWEWLKGFFKDREKWFVGKAIDELVVLKNPLADFISKNAGGTPQEQADKIIGFIQSEARKTAGIEVKQ